MDFNNGLYVFNGVPGLDASKGERIVKALQKLQAKIKYLEQIRESEREKSSKDQADNEKELTFTDIQFKLLVLQLQYIRTILRRNSNVPNENINVSDEIQNFSQETQTGVSLCEANQETRTKENVHNLEEQFNVQASQYNLPIKEIAKSTAVESNQDCLPDVNVPSPSNCTPMHYHLKFDDVPFILGASSSASHNIVANVQNIIAMMKNHNKALCGTKHQASRNPAVKTSQDTNKIMKNLSEELSELQKKQANLIQKIDFAQKGNHFSNAESRSKSCDHFKPNKNNEQCSGNYLKDGNIATNFQPKKCFPGDKGKEIAKKEKPVVPTNRIKSNFPQASRQRLFRSIQEFKTHLSEEDMSWV